MTSIRSETTFAILRQLDEWNLRYCVLRGFEGPTHEPGRDVDLVVEPSDLARLGAAIAEQAERYSWQVVVRCRGHHEGTSFFLLSAKPGEHVDQLELHATKVGWAGLPILPESEILEHRIRNKAGVWMADDLHRAVQRLAQHVLASRSIDNDTWLSLRMQAKPDATGFRKLLVRAIGSERFGASIAAAVNTDRPQDVYRAANLLRANFIAGRLRSQGLAALRALLSNSIARGTSSHRPARCGVLAVVDSHDTARAFSQALRPVFLRTEHGDTDSQRNLKGIVDRAGLILATPTEVEGFPQRLWGRVLIEAGSTVDSGIKAVIDKFVANHEIVWSASMIPSQQG